MAITVLDYVPVLKWRQGEYQALLRLSAGHKAMVRPLIEITPPEYDFEKRRAKKTLIEQLEPFAERLRSKWGSRPAFLDTSLLEPTARLPGGVHPLDFLMEGARTVEARLIPVTALDRDLAHYNAVARAMLIDGLGVALRCSLDDIADPDFPARLSSLLGDLNANLADVDLIIDLAAKNFDPIEVLAELLVGLLDSDPIFGAVRSLILVGTSFPASMGEVKPPIQKLKRWEWLLYKAVIAALPPGARQPTFGDYAISSVDMPGGDMRLIKPSATVRYAVDDAWLIAKGVNVRDNGYEQYRGCCGEIVNSGEAYPNGYSRGSDYVHGCYGNVEKTGNMTTWRWVGTNHHITKVVDDLASFHGL